jgi:serine/threonine protein kinase
MRPGDVLAERYELRERIGVGGMAEVFAGVDRRLDRPVALKVLHEELAAQEPMRKRFEAEARAAATLAHPNVVAVFDVGRWRDRPFIVTELLPGRTLADEIAQGPMPPDRVRQIALGVLDALAAAHQAGIIHRDVKPANILIDAAGAAKIADFGIAKAAGQAALTQTGALFGTPAYLAPEVLSGAPATVRSDVHSLGVVLYEALSGRRAFVGENQWAVMTAIQRHEFTPLAEVRPDVDPALCAVVERAMSADPADRFDGAEEMAVAMRSSAAESIPSGATVPTPATETSRVGPETLEDVQPGKAPAPLTPTPSGPAVVRTRRPVRTRTRPWIVAGLVILVLVAALAFLLPRLTDTPAAGPGRQAGGKDGGVLPSPLEKALDRLEEAVKP